MTKFLVPILVLLAISAGAASCGGCTDNERSERVLTQQGYRGITLTGYDYGGCSRGDTYCTGFEAQAPSGAVVTGAVGCGASWSCTGGKGCTVRTY